MDIYETIAEVLRERIDQATKAMELFSEAISFACQTVEEVFEELRKMFDSIKGANSEDTGAWLGRRSKRLQRPCRKVVVNYNYIPVTARNLPYQRRAF